MNRSPSRDRWAATWWIGLTAVAAAASLYGSWSRPVWHDELYTLALARMPLPDLLSALRVDSGPPLHYLICHLLFAVVGWAEGSDLGTMVVRLPSVLAFSAMPWVVWRWARRGVGGASWSAVLVVVWLPMLYFATEARVYALLSLVNGAVWLLGPRLMDRGRVRLVVFVCLAAALPLLHYAGVASFLCLPLMALWIRPSRRRVFAWAWGAAAVPLLCWLPVLLGAPQQSMAWVDAQAGPGRPGLGSLLTLGPAGPYPALYESPDPVVPVWLSMVALAGVLAACVLALGFHRRLPVDHEGAREGGRLGLALLPVGGLAVLGMLGVPSYFAGRTESLVWLVVGALVWSSARSLSRPLALVLVGPYLVIATWTVSVWLAHLPTRPDPVGVQIGLAMAPEIQPGDAIVVAGLWQLEVEHGLERAAAAGQVRPSSADLVQTLPSSQADHPGWLDLEALTSPALTGEARQLERDLRAAGSRMWLVWSPATPLERTVLAVFSGWRRQNFGGSPYISVDLFMLDDDQEQAD